MEIEKAFEVSSTCDRFFMALPSFHSLTKYYLQDINQVNTHADEMDLFTMVTRRFKKMFSKQEQMRTFPVYDASIEVSQVHNNCTVDSR